MGVEYAIVHDETREAYELGKGLGYDWFNAMPASRDEVAAAWARNFREQPAEHGIKAVAAIWHFIETHPGCKIISDCGDAWWTERDLTARDIETWPEGCYRQIGSRYTASADT